VQPPKKAAKSICKIIYLEWCDAIADSSRWMSIKEAKDWGNNEDWLIKQVCFLLDETQEYLLLAGRINPHQHTEDEIRVDSLLKLPKTWIRNRIDLSGSI
jgi:hypothetical protein